MRSNYVGYLEGKKLNKKIIFINKMFTFAPKLRLSKEVE